MKPFSFLRLAPFLFLAAIGFVARVRASPPPPADPAGSATTEYGPAHGTLVIVGGGSLRGTGIMEKFVQLAGGPNAKIIVVPTAGGKTMVYDEAKILAPWKDLVGVKSVRMIHTFDPKVADTEEFARPIREATGVWFNGGRQWNLVDSYHGTLTEREFNRVLERGGVIGGSSAGATIQGDYLVRGAVASPDIMMTPEPEHEHGFAFLRRSAIDQHIDARSRWDDLIPVIRKYPELLGIGLSENTAIIVTGDRFEVMGRWKVAIHDNTRVYRSNEKPYYLLSAGEVYNMKTRRVEISANGQPPCQQPSAATADELQVWNYPKAIALDPDTLNRYVGVYVARNLPVMLVTIEKNQLYIRFGNQLAIPIFPISKTLFFMKVHEAKVEFAQTDGSGRANELILQNFDGQDVSGERRDDAKAKLYYDAAAAFAARFKDQTPAPGGEALLRMMAEDFAAGKPASDSISPDLVGDPQLGQVRLSMSKLGALKSLAFKGVGSGGPDIYSVRFEKGALETRIWLGVDGKIAQTNARPDKEVGVPSASSSPH